MSGFDEILPADEPGPSYTSEAASSESTPLLAAAAMVEKNIGISQQTLVSNAGERNVAAARKLPQYVAGVAATLGALACGMVLSWTSALGDKGSLLQAEYGIAIDGDAFSWIGSLVTLGAAAICVPIGILSDLVGRKTAMLVLVVPFTIGWLLIIFSNSVLMFYAGRFLTGVSGGAFCVTAPMYTAEIAESQIRGTLGSYFQLMLTVGILITFLLGPHVSIKQLSLVSGAVPIVFFCVFFFMPETPVYYLKKGDEDRARASLVRLRGPHYNCEPELMAQQEALAEAERNRQPLLQAIGTPAAKRALLVGFGLMLFQQLSGVNAIIFYSTQIFQRADPSTKPAFANAVVGVIQVVAVFLSTLIVDRLGRRILLLLSMFVMCITLCVLGYYFHLQNGGSDVSGIWWLPLACICCFIFIFSIGFGPIPWMMMGEIFSQSIKGVAGSSACLFNWLMAFVVTKYFEPLQEATNPQTCFWLFSGICALGTVFVFLMVPETKGKSLEEIQFELGGGVRSSMPKSRV